MVKTIKNIILTLFLTIMLASCKPEEIEEPIAFENDVFPEEFYRVLADKKVYLTSFGQSIEIEDLAQTMEAIEPLDFFMDNYLEIKDIENDSVLLIVVGCSVKGLQEVGVTTEDESLRAEKIFTKKESKNITIIAFHIGGTLRRGRTSDDLIKHVFSNADFNIFYKVGDFDNKLSLFSYDNNVKMYAYDAPTQLLVVLKKLYYGEEIK